MSSEVLDHVGLLAGTGLAALCLWYWTRPSVPLPPAPLGDLLFVPALKLRGSSAFWRSLMKYSKRYGPIISIQVLFRKLIIINDPSLVSELFEKRAAQFSDRDVPELAKLMNWDRRTLFLKYGPRLKHYRTLLQRALNNRVVVDYLPLQEHEVKRLMKRLVETPEKFMEHIHLMAGSVAIRMAYGHKVNSHDDPFVQTEEQVMSIFADMMNPRRVVNIFPLLRYVPTWFPGATFHKAIESWRPILRASEEKTFAFVKQQMEAGTAEPSFVSKLLEPESGEEVSVEEEVHIKSVAASLYGAASDTTVSAIKTFFLAMTLYPDVQAKAQAEIAAYLERIQPGSTDQTQSAPRFITVADRPNLPYTSALLRELLRWNPVVPLIGHMSHEKDDNNVVVNGKAYRIPGRSHVIVNAWDILHNPEVYHEPERFVPERFLVENPPPIPETYAFGFGRRACPGTHFAQQSMWLSISNILANFSITKAKNENGVEVVPEERYTNDAISHPVPFKCRIQPRGGCREWLLEIED